MAARVRNGEAGPDEVVQLADRWVQSIVQSGGGKVTPEMAKQMVGEQLDKSLPGLGRDILSGISAGVAGFVTGDKTGRFGNVGSATQTRNALRGSGYLR